MAFEQNMPLQNLLSSAGTGGFQPQYPSFRTSPLPSSSGGFLSKIKNFFGGTPSRLAYSSPFVPSQQQAFQQLLQSGLASQQNPYEGFDLLRNQIMQQYFNEIVPQLAEQFTGGTGGASSSPQFAKLLQGSAQSLADRLMAHKIGYGQQNRQFGLQQAQMGLTPQFESAYIPGQEGVLSSLLGRGIPAAASLYGMSRFGGQ